MPIGWIGIIIGRKAGKHPSVCPSALMAELFDLRPCFFGTGLTLSPWPWLEVYRRSRPSTESVAIYLALRSSSKVRIKIKGRVRGQGQRPRCYDWYFEVGIRGSACRRQQVEVTSTSPINVSVIILWMQSIGVKLLTLDRYTCRLLSMSSNWRYI